MVVEEIKTTEQTNVDVKNNANVDDKNEGNGNSGLTEEQKQAEAEAKNLAAKQEKEKNAREAAKRREAEKQAAVKEARFNAFIEATGGKNPFTDEEIKDEADLDEYLLMKKIEKAGDDPIQDYHKYLKEERKNAKNQPKKRDEDWNRKDWQNFTTKHPDITLKQLEGDKKFLAFAKNRIGEEPLADIYDEYAELFLGDTKDDKAKQEALKKKAREEANKKASPGSLGAGGGGDETFFTMDQIKNMNKKEVHDNFDKIQKSLKHIRSKG